MTLLALVDCNNFYVSCERVFQPRFNGVPVVVLSNNDGCAIARSAEAKGLGIRIGTPIQDLQPLIRRHGIKIFSSNYALYGDMSRRVTEVLRGFSPDLEVYSIDESFLSLEGVSDPVACGRSIRATVLQWTGIPTCVGIGPTKTLAKLANAIAKRQPDLGGVCDLSDPAERARQLAATPVGDIWGIGPALAGRLNGIDVRTVGDLIATDSRAVRSLLTVVGERILHELQGVSCLALEDLPAPRKGMASTRSFGRPVTVWGEMSEALVTYTTRVAERLRAQGLATADLTVFLETNRFKPEEPHYCPSRTLQLPAPTCDTLELVEAALRAGRAVWRDGYRYKKAGVILNDLVPPGRAQRSLFAVSDAEQARRTRLMAALDRVNGQHGQDSLMLASSGLQQPWAMRCNHMSPRWTTCWEDLPKVG